MDTMDWHNGTMDWFLYDIGLGRERVKFIFDSNFENTICSFDKRKKIF